MKATLANLFTEILSGDPLGAALMPGDEIEILSYVPGCSDPGCCESEVTFTFNGGDGATVGSIYADKIIIGQQTLADIIRRN